MATYPSFVGASEVLPSQVQLMKIENSGVDGDVVHFKTAVELCVGNLSALSSSSVMAIAVVTIVPVSSPSSA